MASLVQNNPFDTQQPKPASNGLVSGAMQPPKADAQASSQPRPQNTVQDAQTSALNPAAATYQAATRQINPQTETVQGQVNSILSKDNPLMQRARTLATQQMAQRGLVNSSMAAGAGAAAMIDRATSIAQQDANAFNQAASENMAAKNTAAQTNVGESNKFSLQGTQQTFDAGQLEKQQSFTTSERIGSQSFAATMENAKQNFTAAQSDLDRALMRKEI